MDFLTFLQRQATSNNGNRNIGPGTPGYAAAQLGKYAQMPEAPAPAINAPTPVAEEGGGFWDTLNPFSSDSDWGSRALDVLSRPSYAMNNILQERARDISEAKEDGFDLTDLWAQINPQVGQAWQGLSGQQKETGSDVVETVVEESGGDPSKMNKWVKGGLGLGIDIFADPTTYIGLGAVKSVAKGGAGLVKTAAKTTDDMAEEITEAAVRTNAPKPVKESAFEEPRIHPDQGILFGHDEAKLFDVKAGTKVEKPQHLSPVDEVMPTERQPTLFEAPEVPKVVPDTIKITTDDLPFTKATVTDRTKGMIQQLSDFSQMPVPTGSPLTQLEGGWLQPGSTSAYSRAGSRAVNNAEEVVEKSEHFESLVKGKTPAQLSEAYKAGAIRPPLDTPAERAFFDAVSVTDLRKANDPLAKLDFYAVPDIDRAMMISDDTESLATVFGGATGKVKKAVPAKKLWDALHGVKTDLDVNKTFLRVGKQKVKLSDVIKGNKKALSDPKFWAAAGRNAAHIQKNPRGYAEQIAKQNVDHIRMSERIVYDDFADWAKEAKALFPDLSTETLRAAHDAAKSLLDQIWEKAVVNNPRGNVQKFMAAQKASTHIREAMAEAIARKAPPEELMADIAMTRHTFETETLKTDLNKILESSAPTETKLAAAEATDEAANLADEQLRIAQETASQADAARAAEAQQATSNVAVAEKSREAANFNEIKPGANEVIEGSEWSKFLTKDQAIGVTRSAVGSMLKTMFKKGNAVSYHHMNQTNMLNRILAEVGKVGKGDWQSVIRRRGRAKSTKDARVVALSRYVANLMKATEHQMDEAAGFMPNAWNGGTNSSAGWAVGTPGVRQTDKIATRANVPFSSAHLMDDMIRHDFELIARGGQSEGILPSAIFGNALEKKSALWTKVVESALFKNDALDEIPDPKLRKWLLDYDPTENITMASERYSGKVTQYIKAQAASAEKHVADARVNDSPARASKVESETGKVAKETIQRDPAAPVEDADAIADTAKLHGDELADALIPADPVANKIEQLKLPLGEIAKVNPSLSKANNAARSVQRAAGSTPATKFEALTEVAVDKPWMLRFKQVFQTHAGASTLRPLMQNAFDMTRSATSESARQWKRYEKGLQKATGNDPNLMSQAIKSLDETSAYTAPPGTEDLVRGMRKQMETLLGATDLTRWVTGNTAVTKGAIPREQINVWLKAKGSKFYFQDEKDWMSQWSKSMQDAKTPREALHTLHQIEDAILNAGSERLFFDDMVSRFGSRGGGYTVDHPYLMGVGFPNKQMALEVKRSIELIDELQKPLSSNKILRVYDQALRIWKTGMTIYNPSHHIKNFVGDYWLLMADGGGIRDFKDSVKLLNKYMGKEFDPEAGISVSKKMKDIRDPAKLMEMMLGPAKMSNTVVKNNATKHAFDDAQIMAGAKAHGMFQSAGQLEDIVEAQFMGGPNFLSRQNRMGQSISKPFAGKVHGFASGVAETRDHSVRLAHFIHGVRTSAVRKSKGMTDAQYQKLVFEDAARRSRTHHPDGLDLTAAERKYARRLIPFYSWQRKSIPIILQTAWKRPGLVTAYPKAQTAVTVGTTGESPETGFGTLPGDQMFPSWIDENPWAVIGGEAGENVDSEGYMLAKGPSVPSSDLMPMLNNPMTNLGQLTPFGRVPAELAFGEELATGIPIEGGQAQAEQIAKQIPGVSKLVSAGTNQQSTDVDFRNWLTGMGQLDSGEYIDSALWEKLDKLRKQREAQRNG